ncbi:UDP-glucose 4-epimerase GalE [Nitriliruptor alkaliphilus]|uniref:UDP-glucose 4-epimerase GalE n=1 Tax=Nitriliruptor alkaliphilus TaxID=427918 RepID=UPI000696EA0C|nr:UDP-glucose 4-epimerase GalE [Nitriliruptor alkaliphilus]
MQPVVLVTGGAGYIGSHTCKALHGAGYAPVSYDDLERGHVSAVQWGPLQVGSLQDQATLRRAFETYRPIAVLHFAALAYVGESMQEPGRYYTNNVGGTLALLEAMRDHGVDQFVFSSTCATFGVPAAGRIGDDDDQHPINPYGSSKLMVERILRDYETVHGLRSVVLRYFNAAGADPDVDIGERHEPETHLLPLVLAAAAGHLEHVEVFGDDYPTPDGTCVRDYVHVSDLADAHVRALEHLRAGGASLACNLGTGVGASVLEVIDQVERTTGRSVARCVRARREGDPPELVAAVERARRDLGWNPSRSDLATIVEDAWRWYRSG